MFTGKGRLIGTAGALPTFAGRVKGTEARLRQAVLGRSGKASLLIRRTNLNLNSRGPYPPWPAPSTELELTLALDNWGFFLLTANGASMPTSLALIRTNLQPLFGTSYPVHGMLSGQFFTAKGTRANPETLPRLF